MSKQVIQKVADVFRDFSFRTRADLATCVEATIRSALGNAQRSLIIVDGPACSGKTRLIRTACAVVQPGIQTTYTDASVLCDSRVFLLWSREKSTRVEHIAPVEAGLSYQLLGCDALKSLLDARNRFDDALSYGCTMSVLAPAIWVEWRRLSVLGFVRPDILRRTKVISVTGCDHMPTNEKALGQARKALAELQRQNPSADEIDRMFEPASLSSMAAAAVANDARSG